MLQNVAVVILNGFTPFELGVLCEVFGVDRTDDGLPAYDFAVVSGETVTGAGEPTPLTSSAGFTVSTPYGLDRLPDADLVAVSAVSDGRLQDYLSSQFPAPLTDALRATVDRGPGCSACVTARSCSARPGCWTGGTAPPTGGMPPTSRGRIRRRSSTRMCCTWTRIR